MSVRLVCGTARHDVASCQSRISSRIRDKNHQNNFSIKERSFASSKCDLCEFSWQTRHSWLHVVRIDGNVRNSRCIGSKSAFNTYFVVDSSFYAAERRLCCCCGCCWLFWSLWLRRLFFSVFSFIFLFFCWMHRHSSVWRENLKRHQ